MDTQIILVYCLCDDYLKAIHHVEDGQCCMSDAEVMTTALVAALQFRCNYAMARKMLQEQGYIPLMLGDENDSRKILADGGLIAGRW